MTHQSYIPVLPEEGAEGRKILGDKYEAESRLCLEDICEEDEGGEGGGEEAERGRGADAKESHRRKMEARVIHLF